eukprot:COSAG06_NODE_19446_length_824_cov_0.932341_3_plen_21_part_01
MVLDLEMAAQLVDPFAVGLRD